MNSCIFFNKRQDFTISLPKFLCYGKFEAEFLWIYDPRIHYFCHWVLEKPTRSKGGVVNAMLPPWPTEGAYAFPWLSYPKNATKIQLEETKVTAITPAWKAITGLPNCYLCHPTCP